MTRSEKIQELTNQRAQLIAYMQSKIKANDLHVVQDAASYIREIDAALKALHEVFDA